MPIYYQLFRCMSSIFYINICIILVISFHSLLFLHLWGSEAVIYHLLFRQVVSLYKKRRPEILSVRIPVFCPAFFYFPRTISYGMQVLSGTSLPLIRSIRYLTAVLPISPSPCITWVKIGLASFFFINAVKKYQFFFLI